MFKASLPRVCLTSRSPRPNFVNNPRPPPNPPNSGRVRKLNSQRQREPPKLIQTTKKKNEENSDSDELPSLPEDPPPVMTPERIEFQKLSDRLFCESEVAAMLDYALDTIDVTDQKTLKKLRDKFEDRDFIPYQFKECYHSSVDNFCIDLNADHKLEVQSYLHFQSDSLFKDLSTVFGTTLTDAHVTDPNPTFDTLLHTLQSESETFLNPYHPYEKIQFPFIVCVGGPPGSGRTTVCQFLQKAFDCHIVHVKSQPSSPSSKKGRASSQSITRQSEMPEYTLSDSIEVRYPDEKSAGTLIANAMKENFNGKGYVIDGYPNNKNQQAALSKALSAVNIQLPRPTRGVSKPGRSSASNIDAIIITLFNDGNGSRLIDPISGNIYKVGFHTPCLADLIGICPLHFEEEIRDIQSRLLEINVGDLPILQPKAIQQYKSYCNSLEKSMCTAMIYECERSLHILEMLDTFVNDLYSKNMDLLPNEKPMVSLLRPTAIIRPELCFSAVTAWYRCLEEFGRPMADQSNLISTFTNKVEVLTKAAMERYQLLIGQRDERIDLCREFMKNRKSMNMATHFREIWDLSISIRDRNLALADKIVDNSGLIELLIEVRKSPKIVFIALVNRLYNIMWFSDTFCSIPNQEINDNTRFSFFDELTVPKTDVPKYRFMLTKKPKNIKPVRSVGQFNKVFQDNGINTFNLNLVYKNTLSNAKEEANSKNGSSNTDSFNKADTNPIRNVISKNRIRPNNTMINTTIKRNIKYIGANKSRNASPYQNENQKKMSRLQSLTNQFNMSSRNSPHSFRTTATNSDLSASSNMSTMSSSIFNVDEENEKSLEKQKKERKILSGIGGYDYLLESLGSITPRVEEQIFFDSDEACNALGIINFETKYSFSDHIVKYAEEFFGHVEKLLDSKMVEQEAKISLKLFRRFTTLCKRKEASMVNSVFDLRDSLRAYATNKCTHEMENFARKFRYLKQGGTDLKSPLFVYDMTKINEDVLHLADLAVMLHAPIHDQELLSVPSMLKIAQMIVNKGQICTSAAEFLLTARDCGLSEFEILKLELALRVIECVECFNSQKFLESFIRTKIDSAKLNDIFNRPPQTIIPQRPKVFPQRPTDDEISLSQLSDFYDNEEEEEEEAMDDEEINEIEGSDDDVYDDDDDGDDDDEN